MIGRRPGRVGALDGMTGGREATVVMIAGYSVFSMVGIGGTPQWRGSARGVVEQDAVRYKQKSVWYAPPSQVWLQRRVNNLKVVFVSVPRRSCPRTSESRVGSSSTGRDARRLDETASDAP